MMTVNTAKECIHCQNGVEIEESPSSIWVYCTTKDKRYRYGSSINCDTEPVKKKAVNDENTED